jgi:hypothetical protein
MASKETEQLLRIALEAAVPLWIERMREVPWEELQKISGDAAQYIAEHGDALMYKTKGRTAEAFNRLAQALAILSLVPGGVKFLGLHFETKAEG